MMANRVAALYDIHGNLPALEAVLGEVAQLGVEGILVGGDIFPGPMSLETLARLRELKTPTEFIYGNCEVAVLAARDGRDPGRMPEGVKETMRWTAKQLSSNEETVLRSWPKTLSIEIAGLGEVLFCHGTPRDENEVFTRLSPEAAVLNAFAGVRAKVVVCGHTHMQFDRMFGRLRVVNAGSVGMPFGRPGADWLLLGPDIELRHTEYDFADAAERVRSTPYPQAEEYAAKYILQPPDETEMLELFTRVGVK
jgi:predicted phosphodiesterase